MEFKNSVTSTEINKLDSKNCDQCGKECQNATCTVACALQYHERHMKIKAAHEAEGPLIAEKAIKEIAELFVRPNNPADLSATIDQIFGTYISKIRQFPKVSYSKLSNDPEYLLDRHVRARFIDHFSWAIPRSTTLATLASKLAGYKNILEVGAGSGLWTYLLSGLHAVPIRATDILDGSYGSDRIHKYSPVEQLDAVASIVKYDPEVLMMVWAPYGKTMAHDSLKAFKGNLLVWIGESESGCNGDAHFFTALEKNWKMVDHISMPRWKESHDGCIIFQRKVPNPDKLLVGIKS